MSASNVDPEEISHLLRKVLGAGKVLGEMAFFHERKRRASVRAAESGPAELLSISYDDLDELLKESEATREALHKMADRHEEQNIALREAVP